MLLKVSDCILVMIDLQTRLMPAMQHGSKTIQYAHALTKAAKALGVPVITTEHYPDKIGHTVDALADTKGVVVEKTTFSAAKEPLFMKVLTQLIETTYRTKLLFFGAETHVCVLQSLLETAEVLNDRVTCCLIQDACASRKEMDYRIGIKRAEQNNIKLLSTEMVLFEWLESGENPQFKEIIQIVKPLA